jgi:sterol desaturase/sphingolipid hydroxylase (fatty acid hydroxylase superfamily)
MHLFRGWLDCIVPSGFRAAVRSQSWWLQATETLLLSDFCIYWGHRLQHRCQWLWRFHAVHHSAEHLDWLAAHREHPVDSIYTLAIINLPAFVIGFPLETLAGVLAFRGLWAIFLHSNVRVPLGPLRLLVGSPEIHHWHHSRERESGNYANLSPLMDLIFGTYKCPGHEPAEFGIEEKIASSYVGQLLHPFRTSRREGSMATSERSDLPLTPPVEPQK